MRYGSVCSGIEAATVAWHPLGWTPVFFSEIEPFPSEVLKQRWPDVPNLGDMNRYRDWGFSAGSIDVLVGGTPCQSFSVAGLRGGLDDPRGNLALVFLGIAEHLRPKWLVWENVPGILSSNGGRDFGSILGALAKLGYGWVYRVLDARFFGIPQQRKRVFLVASLGDWRPASAVLLEPAGKRLHRTTNDDGKTQREWFRSCGRSYVSAMTRNYARGVHCGGETYLRLDADADNYRDAIIRRITPLEAERLQGFPDGHTLVKYRGKPAADGPRYKAIGNSMAVPVMRWLGERIERVSSI